MSSTHRAVTWRSTDGIAWRASAPFDIEELPGFAHAASNGSTIVASPKGAPYTGASPWYSIDLGKSWTNVALAQGDTCVIRDVGVAGNRFVVVGHTLPVINTPYPCSWASTDGISWTAGAVLDHEGITLSGAVGVGELAVAVGERPDENPWVGGPAVVLVGDGAKWRRLGSVAVYSGGITPLLPAGNDADAVLLGLGIIGPTDPPESLHWEIWHIPADALAE